MIAAPSQNLIVRVVPGKGRCVFAAQDIAKGMLVIADPIILVPGAESDHTDLTVVGRYVFQWNDEDDLAVVLGLGSLINHGLPENVALVSNYAEQTMEFYATRDIKAGDELVYDYGHDHGELSEYYGIPKDALASMTLD
ncbi:MAG: SET domain-containing protein-lysine N-methyltransferase [Alphaproteobacteria bacterium]|nr:SET domain-containing protein-lysine N-methyltransferase [Alphaproteobacteria bacterium]